MTAGRRLTASQDNWGRHVFLCDFTIRGPNDPNNLKDNEDIEQWSAAEHEEDEMNEHTGEHGQAENEPNRLAKHDRCIAKKNRPNQRRTMGTGKENKIQWIKILVHKCDAVAGVHQFEAIAGVVNDASDRDPECESRGVLPRNSEF
jgi:hypothetical protein